MFPLIRDLKHSGCPLPPRKVPPRTPTFFPPHWGGSWVWPRPGVGEAGGRDQVHRKERPPPPGVGLPRASASCLEGLSGPAGAADLLSVSPRPSGQPPRARPAAGQPGRARCSRPPGLRNRPFLGPGAYNERANKPAPCGCFGCFSARKESSGQGPQASRPPRRRPGPGPLGWGDPLPSPGAQQGAGLPANSFLGAASLFCKLLLFSHHNLPGPPWARERAGTIQFSSCSGGDSGALPIHACPYPPSPQAGAAPGRGGVCAWERNVHLDG